MLQSHLSTAANPHKKRAPGCPGFHRPLWAKEAKHWDSQASALDFITLASSFFTFLNSVELMVEIGQ